MKLTLDDLYVTESVTLYGQKQHSVKIYPWSKNFSTYGIDTDYLKECIQNPLADWCKQTFIGEYELMFRFNNSDPYWLLLLEKTEDFSLFMLRYGGLNKR